MATTNILPSLSSEAFFISIRWEDKKKGAQKEQTNQVHRIRELENCWPCSPASHPSGLSMKEDHTHSAEPLLGPACPGRWQVTFSVFPSSPISPGGNIQREGIRKKLFTSIHQRNSRKQYECDDFHYVYQLDWTTGCPDIRSNSTLGVSARIFLEWTEQTRLPFLYNSAGGAHPFFEDLVGTKRLIFLWARGDFLSLPTFELGHRGLIALELKFKHKLLWGLRPAGFRLEADRQLSWIFSFSMVDFRTS